MAGAGKWRYIAQRFDGTTGGLGQFLDFEVPLSDVRIEDVTSGHNSLTATITPEYTRLLGPDGNPILVEQGTAIWAEDPDGEIRGGGILTHSGFREAEWTLECTDLTGISIELPYTEANFFINVDPLDLYRHIWQYIQSQPNSNLGISIDGTRSSVLLGGDLIQRVDFDNEPDVSEGLPEGPYEDPLEETQPVQVAPNPYASNSAWRTAAVKAMKAVGWNPDVVDDALKKWLGKDAAVVANTWKGLSDRETKIKKKAIEKLGPPPNPPGGEQQRAIPVYVSGSTPNYEAPPTETGTPDPAVEWEYDAYKLNWYTNHDLSETVDDLASLTPFDWHLIHFWRDEEIRHHIRIGYPQLGRRRDDLRFVVGENIQVVPGIERDGTKYANEVLFLGAGEGSSQIMGRAFRRNDGRIRRVAVVSDPAVQTEVLAQQRAEEELARRFEIENIAEVVLTDHPHAPMGSVGLGDIIHLEGETGWQEIDTWVKVLSRSMAPDDGEAMTLSVIRLDRLA